ncbi:MAG: hypothetical protein EZS28_014695 [Streblomastix strix]|uniref:Uncharacterized protein n=1 Tax=Streblomastix strix TaxID=222440 RepID=A0A5J4W4W9_9EUKA|nr:MAG: hypothetical protein EZS28_014695 [Streblomastix strix]
MQSCAGLVAFGAFCGLVFNNWGYICLLFLVLLGFEVSRSVGIGSSFGTPQGLIGQRLWQASFASGVTPNSGGVEIKGDQPLYYEIFGFLSSYSGWIV